MFIVFRRVPFSLLLCLLTTQVGYTNPQNSPQTQSVDKNSAWFLPYLSENNHPKCDAFLEEAQSLFLTNKFELDSYYRNVKVIAGMEHIETFSNAPIWSGAQLLSEGVNSYRRNSENTPAFEIYDSYYVFRVYDDYGRCANWGCNKNSLLIAHAEDKTLIESNVTDKLSVSKYSGFLKDKDGNFWVYDLGQGDTTHIYQLLKSGEWTNSCKIKNRPEDILNSTNSVLADAQLALVNLKNTVPMIIQDAGSGSCGSSHGQAHYYFTNQFHTILPLVLYRPWAVHEDIGPMSYDSYGLFENDMENLQKWALRDPFSFDSHQKFLTVLEQTIESISAFYQHNFGWGPEFSESMARKAIQSAVSRNIRFYRYMPFENNDEEQLRRAILYNVPLEEIAKIPVSLAAPFSDWQPYESMLSIATDYPEVLQYLLEKGVSANHSNAFGKTPLMYAAQRNNLEAVRLLLEAGADPNSRTTAPSITCYYDLKTFNMTALHYATRYASLEVIKTLLEFGASPDIYAKHTSVQPDSLQSPLDWLERYTAIDSQEKNSNINHTQLNEASRLLQQLADEQKVKKTKSLILQAEAEYKNKEIRQAYQTINLALAFEPDNPRALSDMSVISLRNGELGQSAESIYKLIQSSTDPKSLANAWFNYGLVCEQLKKDESRRTLMYNGKNYCSYEEVYSFFQSYVYAPTQARKAKLQDAIESTHKNQYNTCHLKNKESTILALGGYHVLSRYKQITYFVIHPIGAEIRDSDLYWEHTEENSTITVKSEHQKTLHYDSYSVSIFKGLQPKHPNSYWAISENLCEIKSAKTIPFQSKNTL
ncbi:MAG: hypothetical protein Alis3KO_06760 [Aliiglaciecola sp.]